MIVSFDIEVDNGGAGPLTANMWEFGMVLLDKEGIELGEFSTLIRCQEGVEGADVDTISWMKREGIYEKYEQTKTSNTNSTVPTPTEAMNKIGELLFKWRFQYGKLTFVARPAAFDWMFFKSYFHKYADKNYHSLLPHKAVCLSSQMDVYQYMECYDENAKNELWDSLKGKHEHTHCAIDDAREQGSVYIGLWKLIKEQRMILCNFALNH